MMLTAAFVLLAVMFVAGIGWILYSGQDKKWPIVPLAFLALSCLVLAKFPIDSFSVTKDGLTFDVAKFVAPPEHPFTVELDRLDEEMVDSRGLELFAVPTAYKGQAEEGNRRWTMTLPAGEYRILLADTGLKRHFVVKDVRVGEGLPASAKFERFPNAYEVAGVVRNLAGEPAPGVVVKVKDRVTVTDDDGTYVIRELPQGDSLMEVRSGASRLDPRSIDVPTKEDFLFPKPVRKFEVCTNFEKDTYKRAGCDESSFPVTSDVLYSFSRIMGGAGTKIRHVWLRNRHIIDDISLPIDSDDWRTFSFKENLTPGEWKIQIRDQNDNVLDERDFEIEG